MHQGKKWVSCGSVVCALVACGSGASTPESDCQGIANAFCAKLYQCQPQAATLFGYASQSDCASKFGVSSGAGCGSLQGVTNPCQSGETYSSVSAQQCATDIGNTDCSTFYAGAPNNPSCQAICK